MEGLANQAEAKLTPEELEALRNKHLEEFTTWCSTDFDERISPEWRRTRGVRVAYFRIIRLAGETERSHEVTEFEADKILWLRDTVKLSMDEISFIMSRSTSTIHHYLSKPRPPTSPHRLSRTNARPGFVR